MLWDESEKMWFDYDLQNKKPRKYFYPSNLFPLWAESYDLNDREIVAESAVKYLEKTGAMKCKGGIPTSFDNSGQQWDYPNAWPPLQHILVSGNTKILNNIILHQIKFNVFGMSYLNIDQLIIFQDSYKPAVKQLEKWP